MQYKVNKSKQHRTSYPLVQVGQRRPCTFTFALIENDQVYPLHDYILCRDYINDVIVWWQENNFQYHIYGFDYHGPIMTDMTVFCMGDAEHLSKHIHHLNAIESKLGITPTRVYPTDDNTVIVVVGDSFWMDTTLHLSWYTQTLRALSYKNVTSLDKSEEPCIKWFDHFVEKKQIPDGYAFSRFLPFSELPMLFQKLKVGLKRNSESSEGGSMHNMNGFYTQFTASYYDFTYKNQLKALLQEKNALPSLQLYPN